MLDPLTEIGFACATDKAWLHAYTPHYHNLFFDLRHSEVSLLELGVGGDDNQGIGGHSLRMWEKYFSQGQILGIDIHDKKSLAGGRISIETGSQSDPEFARWIIEEYGPFDIIIDDGSHRTDDVVNSLRLFWPGLKNRGRYAIEDMGYAYIEGYNCGRMEDDQSLSTNVVASRVTRLLGRPPSQLDREWAFLKDTVDSIRVYENLAFLLKRDRLPTNALTGGSKERLLEALSELETIIDKTGDAKPYSLTLGRILHLLGEREKSLEAVRQACDVLDDAESWHFLGNILTQSGDLQEALDAQLTSLARCDRNPHVYAAVGVVYAKLGCPDETKSAFDVALSLQPKSKSILDARERAIRVAAQLARSSERKSF